MVVVQRDTVTRQAHGEIRKAILDGRFPPGSKLVVRPLSVELGLSPTPIKMALAALAREGLVEEVPRRGFFVPTFDAKDIRDICTLRIALDRLAAELAAEQPDRTELVRFLNANIKEQRESIRADDLLHYADLNSDFHSAIWKASGNGRLVRVADSLLGQVRLLVTTSSGVPGRALASVREHVKIVAALRAGDTELAAQLAGDHACRSELALLERIGDLPS